MVDNREWVAKVTPIVRRANALAVAHYADVSEVPEIRRIEDEGWAKVREAERPLLGNPMYEATNRKAMNTPTGRPKLTPEERHFIDTDPRYRRLVEEVDMLNDAGADARTRLAKKLSVGAGLSRQEEELLRGRPVVHECIESVMKIGPCKEPVVVAEVEGPLYEILAESEPIIMLQFAKNIKIDFERELAGIGCDLVGRRPEVSGFEIACGSIPMVSEEYMRDYPEEVRSGVNKLWLSNRLHLRNARKVHKEIGEFSAFVKGHANPG